MELLDKKIKPGKPFLIHCWQGRERSPLTVAWFLHKKRNMSLNDAYKFIKSKRDIVEDRQRWVEDRRNLHF